MRPRCLELALETAVPARPGASRAWPAAAAARPFPGKLLAKIDPGAVDRWRPGCRAGRRSSRRRTARRRRPRWSPGSSAPRVRLAHNSSGANLVSGVASTLLDGTRRRARPVRGRRGRAARSRRGASGRARSASATCSATSSTATASSSRSPSAGGRPSRRFRTATDARRERGRPAGRRPRRRAAGQRHLRPRRPAQARPSLQHAADSKYCLRCGTPYDYAAAYVGHLGDYRCPPAATRVRRSTVAARAIELARARGGLVRPRHAGGHAPRPAGAARASTTSTTRSPPPRSRARSARRLDEIAARAGVGADRRSGASSGSPSATGGCCCC